MSMRSKPGWADQQGEIDYHKLWAEAEELDRRKAESRRRRWLNWAQGREKAAPYSPWLVVPSGLQDYGWRPLAPGVPYWASPFITVTSPDPSGRPLAGAKNYLSAQVFNLGAATAAPTKVDFLWADPSIGLGPSDFTLIGSEWVEVQPMSSAMVTCQTPWVPAYANQGHECVLVHCDNHILDPIQTPFEPWNDRHVGQRNLSVLPAVAQKFSLWTPLGYAGAPAEIRVLALKGIAPGGFQRRSTPYETVIGTLQEVLRGFHQARGRRSTSVAGKDRLAPPLILVEKIPSSEVIRQVSASQDYRALLGHEWRAFRQMLPAARWQLGERVLQLDGRPGTGLRFELELMPLELGINEVIVLNVTHCSMGVVTGGYTLGIVPPACLGDSTGALLRHHQENIEKENGSTMNQAEERLERLVIEQHPETRITYQLTKQLAPLLPLESAEQVMEKLRGELTVEGQGIPVDAITPHLTGELFPIEDLEDLVVKLTAATRVVLLNLGNASREIVTHPSIREVLTTGVAGPSGKRSPIPAGHFTGPSIFGYRVADQELKGGQ